MHSGSLTAALLRVIIRETEARSATGDVMNRGLISECQMNSHFVARRRFALGLAAAGSLACRRNA
jgi:hypothetical protein